MAFVTPVYSRLELYPETESPTLAYEGPDQGRSWSGKALVKAT